MWQARSQQSADRRAVLRRSGDRRGWRVAAAAAAVVAAVLVAPGTAPAAVSCAFNEPTGFLTVDLSATNDGVHLLVATNGEIVVVAVGGGQIACTGAGGPPAASTTDSILVTSRPGAANTAVLIHEASRFGPGVSNEGGGTREIEIFVNLNDEPGTQLLVSDDNATIRLGSGGINPNAFAAEVVPDADIFPAGVRSLAAVGAEDRADTLGAQGGAGTGDPLAAAVLLSGQGGADSLTGGDGPDILAGGDGNDHLSGGGGDDSFDLGSGGDDVIDGGPGTDVVSYDDATSVSVDLAIAGPQPTGAGNDSLANIENLIGTRGADVLRGDGRGNALFGHEGPDVLEGRGGEDSLDGGQDADSLDVRDGGPDLAECGAGTDTASVDLAGVDRLFNCETVLLPPANVGSGKETTAPSENPGAAHADRRAPSFLGPVKADPTRFEVARKGDRARVLAAGGVGTTFRYSLSEPATVTFAIERRTSGRKVKGGCRATTQSNARRPRCARFRRIGSFDARAAAGANRTPFSGRIRTTPLRPGPYRALLTAVDAAGNRSTRATVSFTVLRPKPRGRAD